MTKLELAQRTKAKYPQYKDIDDNELAERILAKYPVYRSQITEQPQQTALQKMTSNIKTKVSSRVSDFGQDIKSAKDTPGSIQGSRAALRVGGAVAGSLNDILFEGLKAVTPDKVEQLAKAGISKVMSTEPAQYVAEKISAWAERNPESAKDLQDVLEISSAIPVIKGAQVATKATIRAGKMATTAGKKALGKTLATAGAVAEKGGKAVVAATYPPTASQARGLVAYKAKTPLLKRVSDSAAGISKAPTTPADVAVKYGLVGIRRSDIGAKAKRISNQLFENQVKPVIDGIKKRVKTATLFDEVKNQINNTADISKKKALLNALESLKDDYKGVSSLSYKQLDKIKSEMAKGLPAKVWKGQDIAGDINNVRKIFSDKARAIIRKELPDSVKTVYDEYGSLMSIVEKGEKSLQRGLDSGVLGLTSEAIRTAGTPITTIGGKAISDIGTGVKRFGQKLLKTKPLPKGKGEILKTTPLIKPQKAQGEVLPKQTTKVSSEAKQSVKTEKLNTLNPTGSIFADYTPAKRATAELADNITTLDKTMGKSADEMITIYRGSGNGGEIVPGDFITTNKQLAKDYAGTGKVLEKKVKLSDVLDDITEPLGEEYIYRPKTSIKSTPLKSKTDNLIQEAKKYKSADEFKQAFIKNLEETQTEVQRTFGANPTKSLNEGKLKIEKVNINKIKPEKTEFAGVSETGKIKTVPKELDIGKLEEFKNRLLKGEKDYPYLVVDKNYNIIAGNHRLEALKRVGETEVNIIKLGEESNLTDIWNKANKKLKK